MGCTACLVCLPLVLELNTYMYQNEGTIKINKACQAAVGVGLVESVVAVFAAVATVTVDVGLAIAIAVALAVQRSGLIIVNID